MVGERAFLPGTLYPVQAQTGAIWPSPRHHRRPRAHILGEQFSEGFSFSFRPSKPLGRNGSIHFNRKRLSIRHTFMGIFIPLKDNDREHQIKL